MHQLAKMVESLASAAAAQQQVASTELTQHLTVLCHVAASQPQLTMLPATTFNVSIPAVKRSPCLCTRSTWGSSFAASTAGRISLMQHDNLHGCNRPAYQALNRS